MDFTYLGRTGLQVSRLCLGTMNFGPRTSEKDAHALMDVGAMLCRPRSPRCSDCPAEVWCRFAAGDRPATATDRPRSSGSRPREPAFPSTTRWLRGRIVDRARDADDCDWISFGDAIGTHDRHAVPRQRGEGPLLTE